MKGEKVKFKTKMISKEIPSDSRIKELKRWCEIFHKRNLAPPYEGGSHGNLSFRLNKKGDRFIITGSRIGLKNKLTPACFVEVVSCDLNKKTVHASGIRKPSSETMLHFAIYHKRKDVRAIFHGHSKKIIASAKKLALPVTIKEAPYGTVKLTQRVLEILDGEPFLVMKNHGFISVGKSMKEVGRRVLKINKMCK